MIPDARGNIKFLDAPNRLRRMIERKGSVEVLEDVEQLLRRSVEDFLLRFGKIGAVDLGQIGATRQTTDPDPPPSQKRPTLGPPSAADSSPSKKLKTKAKRPDDPQVQCSLRLTTTVTNDLPPPPHNLATYRPLQRTPKNPETAKPPSMTSSTDDESNRDPTDDEENIIQSILL